jgi:putative tricarboxylic transport membrane protein
MAAPAPTHRGPVRPGVRREALVAIGSVLVALLALLVTTRIRSSVAAEEPGAAAWPTALAVGLAILGVLMLARPVVAGLHLGRRTATSGPGSAVAGVDPVTPGGVRRVVFTVAAVAGYGLAWHWLDFRVCTVAFVAAVAAIGGARGWRALIAFPVLLTGLLWMLFGVLLEVPL